MGILRYRKPLKLDELNHYHHAVIEASAGTGKTYTMEHLVVDLLLSTEVTIEEILVVTFTERATGELKHRIRGLIERIIRACERGDAGDDTAAVSEPHWELGPEAHERLKAALFSFDVAPIYTIHGFCQRVLTEHAFENRRLFDEEHVDQDALFDEVFADALRRDFASDPNLSPYLMAWMETQAAPIESLRKLLLSCVTSRSALRPDFDEGRLLEAIAAMSERDEQSFLAALEQQLKAEKVKTVTIKAVLSRVVQVLEAVRAWRTQGSVARFLAEMESIELPYLRERRETLELGGREGASLLAILDAIVPLKAAVALRFTAVMTSRLRQEKDTRGVFAFDDMLSMVWESLDEQGSTLVEGLRRRYRYGLIDEFQDTDDLQWRIFRRLFFESRRQCILYLIGDPKQAIYSFRGADVHTYLTAREEVLSEGGRLVRLEENFRSTGAMIAGYNHVFDQTAEQPFFTGAIDYSHPVSCGREGLEFRPGDGLDGRPIQVLHVPGEEGRKLRADELRHGLARSIAAEVKSLLERGAVIGMASENGRAIAPKNVFILTQKASEGELLGEYLRAEGVPFAFYKQDGLFQTRQARDIFDVLSAVCDPYDRARRLGAWLTPFFSIPLRDLEALDPLDETDPLFELLAGWHRLGQKRRYEELFARMLEESGLLRREIFFHESERALTNYLHIFEILLEETHRRRLELADLVMRLKAFIDGRALPEGESGNVQRLESERDAVQIMTMHKSKGLEADVVFVYGGFTQFPPDGLYTFHDRSGQRVLHVGAPEADDLARCEAEAAEEEQRLLYVALTRARGQLYLPFVASGDYAMKGCYRHVNERLEAIVDEVRSGGQADLFCLRAVSPTTGARSLGESRRTASVKWTPPAELLEAAPVGESFFAPFLTRRLIVTSYSRIKQSAGGYQSHLTRNEFRADAAPLALTALGVDALPGGAASGNFLHEVIEALDFELLRRHETLGAWLDAAEVDEVFRARASKFGIEASYLPYSKEVIHRTLTAPVEVESGGHGIRLESLASCEQSIFELEFMFPIPEASHRAVSGGSLGELEIRRGYIKGFVDFVFEHEGMVYFADWKSDILDDYRTEALRAHIMAQYALQARLYSLAMVRALEILDEPSFEARFGGFFYFFLRGMGRGDGKRGIYFERPSWEELRRYEEELMTQTEYV
jgi:exodeoxyribonuclease V beta subunit